MLYFSIKMKEFKLSFAVKWRKNTGDKMDFPSAKLLTSMQNPLVKQVAKWRDRHDRDADQKVLIEGYRALTRPSEGLQ